MLGDLIDQVDEAISFGVSCVCFNGSFFFFVGPVRYTIGSSRFAFRLDGSPARFHQPQRNRVLAKALRTPISFLPALFLVIPKIVALLLDIVLMFTNEFVNEFASSNSKAVTIGLFFCLVGLDR